MASRQMPQVLWRIIDANANRAMEGARAAEEVVRFGWNDRRLTARLRRLRQAIGRAVVSLPGGVAARLAARDIRRDVGRKASPRRAPHWSSLLADNMQRLKEALRVLEECARVAAPTVARQFQRLRFEAYELEQHLHRRLATLRHSGRRGAPRARRRGSRPRRH